MLNTVSNLWSKLMEFIFPNFCLGCKKEGIILCKMCLAKIEKIERQNCPVCKKPQEFGFVCRPCRRDDFYLDGLLVSCHFEKNFIIRDGIHTFKYNFVEELGLPLAKILFETWQKFINSSSSIFHERDDPFLKDDLMICPVPLHKKRLRFRGFNQASILAKEFCVMANLEQNYLEILDRLRFSRPQMELSREERLKNVVNTFVLKENLGKGIKDGNIILIDDVATTMATLNQCAKVLKQGGAKFVYGFVVAHGGG